MRILNHTTLALGLCILFAKTGTAQELAAFKIPDSPRGYLFNCRTLPEEDSTNGWPRSVEGTETILAKRFKTMRQSALVTIVFYDVLYCRANRRKGEKSGSVVMTANEYSVSFPRWTSVLVHGQLIRLADFSEDSFKAPAPHYDHYEGKDALKKLKEVGLDPPDDMDGTPEKGKSGK
jgi:hypothetical protein